MDKVLQSNAPFTANAALLIELAMGIALLFGAWLARRQRYRQHAWCQSVVVLLNVVIIALAMAPSFYARVLPKIPARLDRSFYAMATMHAVAAAIAQFGALYILAGAGTKLLPQPFRLTNYKRAMRSVLALWWLSLLLGIATYLRWYIQW